MESKSLLVVAVAAEERMLFLAGVTMVLDPLADLLRQAHLE